MKVGNLGRFCDSSELEIHIRGRFFTVTQILDCGACQITLLDTGEKWYFSQIEMYYVANFLIKPDKKCP